MQVLTWIVVALFWRTILMSYKGRVKVISKSNQPETTLAQRIVFAENASPDLLLLLKQWSDVFYSLIKSMSCITIGQVY